MCNCIIFIKYFKDLTVSIFMSLFSDNSSNTLWYSSTLFLLNDFALYNASSAVFINWCLLIALFGYDDTPIDIVIFLSGWFSWPLK